MKLKTILLRAISNARHTLNIHTALLLLLSAWLAAGTAPQASGAVLAWGNNYAGQLMSLLRRRVG